MESKRSSQAGKSHLSKCSPVLHNAPISKSRVDTVLPQEQRKANPTNCLEYQSRVFQLCLSAYLIYSLSQLAVPPL